MKDKLEIGSGQKPTPGYLHQDISRQEGVKLDFLCNPWEIDLSPGSLSEVVALGVVEHLRYEEVKKTLDHMNFLLKKGGSFLFDVPDMKVWSEYLYNTTHGKSEKNPFSDEHVWATIYGWQRWPGDEHKSGWTDEKLSDLINNSGYSQIVKGVENFTKRGFQRGRFTREGDAHLYFEAKK